MLVTGHYLGWISQKKSRQVNDFGVIGLGFARQSPISNEDPDLARLQKIFMHGPVINIGLNTHDYGAPKTPMKANMVFTVEREYIFQMKKWDSV